MSNPKNDTPAISPAAQALLNKDNQLIRPLLSVIGMSPFVENDTSPRKQMFSGNLGAFQVIKGATERFIQTGMEREYGKYTFNVKAPENIRILKIIDRYPPRAGAQSIRFNPETLVIYEEIHTRIVGCLSIENYKTNHPHFGFVYRPGPAYSKLRQGAEIQKGEVFLESPNVTEDGGYMFGGEFKVAKMSVPGSSEDGIIASKSAIRRLRWHSFETRVIECDANMIPLNLYPKSETGSYGICPEIGDPVRDDGLVMALRPYNEATSVYDLSRHGLMEFQDGYDKPFKAPPGGKVIDIKVHRNPMLRQPRVPFGMDEQLIKYYEADKQFYQEIFNEYLRLKRIRKESLRLTPAFHALLVYAQFPIEKDESKLVVPYHRKAKINDWRIEITIQYLNTPGVGFKVTGAMGDSE